MKAKTIKVEELRIGNYVNHTDNEDIWIMSIETISKEACHTECNGIFDYIEPELLEPIPLTEEWLIKFGYNIKRETNLDDLYEFHRWELTGGAKDRDRNMITYDRNKNQFTIWDDLKVMANLRRNNVHSLQNLYFALIGEELTIK